MWQLLVVLANLHAAPPVRTPAEVVTGVQTYYKGVQKLSADFRQEYVNTTFGKSSISDGKVFIAKPGKMRWDYAKTNNVADKKYFISDGTTLWVYEEKQKQAFRQSLKDQLLPVAVTFLYGQGNLEAEFKAELDQSGKYGGKDDYVLKLTPKKPSAQYKLLWLVVDPADYHVRESIIVEASDNVNRFAFVNLKQNDKAKFSDKHFKFTPPPGVKVVEPE